MPDQPAVALTQRQQDDLELLLAGALHPLVGFGGPETGVTVVVPAATLGEAGDGGPLRLLDEEGAPLAEMVVAGTYRAGSGVGAIGPVRGIGQRAPRPFERYYRRPGEGIEPGMGAPSGELLLVPTDRVLTAADVEHLRGDGRRVVLLALVGAGSPIGATAAGLIRSCLAAAGALADAEVIAVPLARRDQTAGRPETAGRAEHGGPDEHTGPADRADPGLSADRGDRIDRELRERVVAHYSAGTAGTAAIWWPDHQGPAAAALAAAADPRASSDGRRGVVILFTGLSGSGKSTVARGVRNALLEDGRRTVTLLDGDVVRRNLSSGLGFSRADRETNVRRIGWVAAEIARHGGIAIASPIAPFAATRSAVRDMARDAGADFLLVHVATPLAECERRDRKGLYARARRGEIADFTGISSPYEAPGDPDLRIDTTACTVDQAVEQVLSELNSRGLVARGNPASEPAAAR